MPTVLPQKKINFYYMLTDLNNKLLLAVGQRNTGTPVLSESSGHLLETGFVLKNTLQLSLRSFFVLYNGTQFYFRYLSKIERGKTIILMAGMLHAR